MKSFFLILILSLSTLHLVQGYLAKSAMVTCQVPQVMNGRYVSQGHLFLFGYFAVPYTTVKLTCDPGYKIVLGRPMARCLRSGQWSTRLGKCWKGQVKSAPRKVNNTPAPKRELPEIIPLVREENSTELERLLQWKINLNVQDSNGWTPLIWSIFKGHQAMALLIISQTDVNINIKNRKLSTALHFAAKLNNTKVVEALIKKGANPNSINFFNVTPLHLAAQNGSVANVKAMLRRAIINVDIIGPWNQTALVMAAAAGHELCVDLLIQNEANINQRDVDDETAMMKAARAGHSGVVESLIRAGAWVTYRNKNGLSALLLAQSSGKSDIVEMLEGISQTDQNYQLLPI